MNRNTERLAWVILLASFFICVGLTVMTPLSIRWYIRNARVDQKVYLEVQRPPLSVTLAGRGRPISTAEDRDDVPPETIIATNATSGRLVMRAPQAENGDLLATVQIYDNTEVVVASAKSPRFGVSRLPHRVVLEVKRGRVRISIPGDGGRATFVEVQTPQGHSTLQEGRYTLGTDDETTQVTVQEGLADLTSSADDLHLSANERALMASDGTISGPLPAARNMIVNGDFSNPLGEYWSSYSRDIQIEGESGGQIREGELEGRPVVVIEREGEGHAETGIKQQVDENIRDFTFLQLHLLLQIERHDVPVCGSLGSECPVMVRIDYRDANGGEQQWLQGFYTRRDTSSPSNPSFCVTCNLRNQHIWVPENTWFTYESPNLIPVFSQDGRAPTEIESVTVYASGHTYRSMIAEVELIGEE